MGEYVWVVACELIATNHEREIQKESFPLPKNLQRRRRRILLLESKEKKWKLVSGVVVISKTQGECLPLHIQGRALFGAGVPAGFWLLVILPIFCVFVIVFVSFFEWNKTTLYV